MESTKVMLWVSLRTNFVVVFDVNYLHTLYLLLTGVQLKKFKLALLFDRRKRSEKRMRFINCYLSMIDISPLSAVID